MALNEIIGTNLYLGQYVGDFGTPIINFDNAAIATALGLTIANPAPTTPNLQDLVYFAPSQAFNMTATGLKPSTLHTFTFNNANVTAQCAPQGASIGTNLISGADGTLNFTFYYQSGLSSTASTLSAAQSILNSMAGDKVGILQSLDGTSTATVTVTLLKQNVTTPPASPTPQAVVAAASGAGQATLGGGGGKPNDIRQMNQK